MSTEYCIMNYATMRQILPAKVVNFTRIYTAIDANARNMAVIKH